MPDPIHTKRSTGSRPPRLLAAAAIVSGVLAAGCGGSSPSATTTGSSTATSGGATTAPPAGPAGVSQDELAFARCMRANGVTNFPDPNPNGRGFRLPVGANPQAPALRAAQTRCHNLLPGGGPPPPGSATHPSAQTLAKLDRIARCMREHGVPQFPDPRTSIPSNPAGIGEITDFDDAILLFPSTLDMQAPAYRHALTACGAPPLGLPH